MPLHPHNSPTNNKENPQNTMATSSTFEIKDEQRPLTEIPVSPPNGEETSEDTGDMPTEQLTVFHSADNFNVKHPLMNKWTLWFTKPPGKVSSE
jgi:translation initiation factor 4E